MSKKKERTLMTIATFETDDGRSDDIDKNPLSITTSIDRTSSVVGILARHSFVWARGSLERLPIRMTLSNLGVLSIILAILLPKSITYILVYPIFRLVFGTLYPAYASYKAVRTQNVKEYVKWMMYWIVFALFTCAETFTDVFFSFWFPFYYEIKIILVLWLLSPATKGSSILYRRFVHPALTRREAKIDETLARATEQGYKAVLHLGTRGVNYATTVLMQTAIKNLPNLVPTTLNALSGSQSDLAISSSANMKETSTTDHQNKVDVQDGISVEPQTSTTKQSIRNDDTNVEQNFYEVTTDEETENDIERAVNEELVEQRISPMFKVPSKQLERTMSRRRNKKERGMTTRRQKSRSRKGTFNKNYESDFSDELNVT